MEITTNPLRKHFMLKKNLTKNKNKNMEEIKYG